MLVPQLRIQLCQGLVFRTPRIDLLLQRADLVVLAGDLLAVAVLELQQLSLQGLDALVVLL